LAAEPSYPPRNPRPDDEFLARVEVLRSWRKNTGKEMQVKSDVILPRDVMNMIAARDPGDQRDLADIMAEVPWRLERFGDQIMAELAEI
jgi:superfamily II DNA helicase RecQ